jgi:lipopolysaccharide transport protein LptA
MKFIFVFAVALLMGVPGFRAHAAEPAEKVESSAGKESALSSRNDEPISINSDDLEAVMQEGRKKFLFKKNVVVIQGDMTLHTDALEAFYPPGSSDPDRLVAKGHVVMEQEGRKLTCERATYVRAEDKLICEIDAVTVMGSDSLSADRIEMQIETGVVKASGNVQVNVTPKSDDEKGKP